MTSRDFDSSRLDVAAFAKNAGRLEGRWPLREFERLMASAAAASVPVAGDGVSWQARGEARKARSGASQVWLHLEAMTQVPLECQRCLQPVEISLAVNRSFLFVEGEDAAAELDAESEDDVLALTRALDVRALIEDELLLELPIVPRHGHCPEPLAAPQEDPALIDEKPNPFAVLAALKRAGPPN
jgi:uncharacterized protein